MQQQQILILLLLILSTFTVKYSVEAVDLFDGADETNIIFSSLDEGGGGISEPGSSDLDFPLNDNNLWYSGSTSPTVSDDDDDDDDGLLFFDDTIASSSDVCSSSEINPPFGRQRRRALLCPDKDMDIEVRPSGYTNDRPSVPLRYNLEICSRYSMGLYRTRVACDSGLEADRIPTERVGNFDLDHCTPCKFS